MDIHTLHQIFLKSSGVCTDTRKISGNEIFFALKGPNFNANKFALQAINKGCSYAVVDEIEEGVEDKRLIKVEDGLACLQTLANYHRSQFNIPVIGITGSNGKTTNKELINAVLSKKYNVLCTAGNFNNHIGVPLTLLLLSNKHEIAIIEMGANHIGEIKELCEIAEPTHGLITNIGIAHLEGFGSVEGIRKTKRELFDFVTQNGGVCFVNVNNEQVQALYKGILEEAIFYGNDQNEPFTILVNTESDLDINIHQKNETLNLQSNLIGKFQANNLLNAFVIGQYFSVEENDIVNALEEYIPQNNRSQQIKWKDNLIVLDAYNANPSSMKSAIESFVEHPSNHKVIILGDMLELGEASTKYHQEIVDILRNEAFEEVILVGNEFSKSNFPDSFSFFEEREEVKAWLEQQNFKHKTFLVKGSRGIGLEKIFQ